MSISGEKFTIFFAPYCEYIKTRLEQQSRFLCQENTADFIASERLHSIDII